MSIKKQGNIREHYPNGVALQPGYELEEKDDGTISGTCEFHCDRADVLNLPKVGDRHPAESKCELYAFRTKYVGLSKVIRTASYFGILNTETEPIISNNTNANREAIETHPDFIANLAGTSAAPVNGAKFDSETGEFLGFFDPEKDFFGLQYHFTGSTQVSLSYWTRKVPTLKTILSVRADIPKYKKPPGVEDFLLVGSPYRQVGTHYQITENYLGSGESGWNRIVYPKEY